MARTPEGEAQAAILNYLAAKRVFAVRLNNQPIYDPKRGVFRALPKHTPKGLPDILVVKNGNAIFLEVKRPDGKLSEEQHEFGRGAMLAGADYHVVHSIDDVIKLSL